jgi:hypothetical protein
LKATASFTNARHEEEPYGDAEGAKLQRMHIARTFTGDLEGESTAELLSAQTEEGAVGYVGHDAIRGTLKGKAGTFVLQHGGMITGDGSEITAQVVPGSGSGELAGLRGSGEIAVDAEGNHTLTLDYEIAH